MAYRSSFISMMCQHHSKCVWEQQGNLIWYYLIFTPNLMSYQIFTNRSSPSLPWVRGTRVFRKHNWQTISLSTLYYNRKLRTVLILFLFQPFYLSTYPSGTHPWNRCFHFVGDVGILHVPSPWWLLDDVPIIDLFAIKFIPNISLSCSPHSLGFLALSLPGKFDQGKMLPWA